jgi:hypothetical protein
MDFLIKEGHEQDSPYPADEKSSASADEPMNYVTSAGRRGALYCHRRKDWFSYEFGLTPNVNTASPVSLRTSEA